MKIAFCLYGPNGLGGPATWVRRMLPRLRQRGFEVAAISYHTTEGDCSVVADLRAAGIIVEVIPAARVAPVHGLERMLAMVSKLRPDVLVADHVIPGFLAGAWGTRFGLRTVAILRSDDAWYHHLLEVFLAGPAALRVAAVVAVSRELAHAAVQVAPAGVTVMHRSSGTVLPVRMATWRANPFHAIYLGRLDEEQKRVRSLVRTLVAMSRAMSDFSATLYGDGPLREEVEATLASQTGHRVSYGGRLGPGDVFACLADAQALVLFSAYEGLSSAIQEAMACGVPVIARRTSSGCEGVLSHGESALVLDSDDELAPAVASLMNSEALWRRLSLAGRQMAESEFDIEIAADRWAGLLLHLGAGCSWPVSMYPTSHDAEEIYLSYLSAKRDLAAFEARFLVERSGTIVPGLRRFLDDASGDWDARRCVLHRMVARGLIDLGDAASIARQLARQISDGEAQPEELQYRVASLHQLAGESGLAVDSFSRLARSAGQPARRAGSLFHLAELARNAGRIAEAVAHVRGCLDIEPDHRSAKLLLHSLTAIESDLD